MRIAISPAIPPVRVSSCTIRSLPVFCERGRDGLLVEGQQGPQVDDLGPDTVPSQLGGRFEAAMHHEAIRHDREVFAL